MDGVVLCVCVACISLLLGVLKSFWEYNVCVNVLAFEYGCVWLLLYMYSIMGTRLCILLSWSHNIVFVSVSVCVCVCVYVYLCRYSGQPAHHNLCFPDSMER